MKIWRRVAHGKAGEHLAKSGQNFQLLSGLSQLLSRHFNHLIGFSDVQCLGRQRIEHFHRALQRGQSWADRSKLSIRIVQ